MDEKTQESGSRLSESVECWQHANSCKRVLTMAESKLAEFVQSLNSCRTEFDEFDGIIVWDYVMSDDFYAQ